MDDSMEHMVSKLLTFNEIRNALASEHPGGQQLPGVDRQSVPLHQFMTRELENMPAMKRMLKDLVAFPQLLLADIRAYRAHVQKNGHCFDGPEFQEQSKCSARAAEIRRAGNALFAIRKYTSANEKYNESICFAPSDSEDLGLGYANRSAVYYETGSYRLALANIDLAKKHNYPEKLMPKLLAREANCRRTIEEANFRKNTVPFPTLAFNLEANPRIPFLAKGIFARNLPAYGSSMLAEKGFKAGDVLLRENPKVVSVCFENKYSNCNHCLAENMFHLIPCPNCSSAMFCTEKCLTEGQKMHRFECGVTAELSLFNDFWAGPRMFFYGLTLFGDDVKKMMEFCQANKESGLSFIDLDYANYDPLEEFKAFLGPKSPSTTLKPLFDNVLQFNAAIIYTMCRKVPLVRSLVTGKAQRDFMLQCFFDYMTLANCMAVKQGIDGQLFPIASCFGRSNDPNTVSVDSGGLLKLIVLRPIRRGERILVSYSPYFEQSESDRHDRLRELGVDCQCRLCEETRYQAWLARVPKGKSIVPAHFEMVQRVMAEEEFNNADKLNALQQFIQRYAHLHPHEDLSTVLSMYRLVLMVSHENEMRAAIWKNIPV